MNKLEDEWTSCKALKNEDHFMISSHSETSMPVKVAFNDEGESLLFTNLWECGWFRLPPTACKEMGHSVAEMKVPSASFSGKKISLTLNDAKFDVFQHVDLKNMHIAQKSVVAWDDQEGIFFFAAEATGRCPSENLAVTFNCSKNEVELVPLDKLELAPAGSCADVDIQGCKEIVKAYLTTKNSQGGNDQETQRENFTYEQENDIEILEVKNGECIDSFKEITTTNTEGAKSTRAKHKRPNPSHSELEESIDISSRKRRSIARQTFSPEDIRRPRSLSKTRKDSKPRTQASRKLKLKGKNNSENIFSAPGNAATVNKHLPPRQQKVSQEPQDEILKLHATINTLSQELQEMRNERERDASFSAPNISTTATPQWNPNFPSLIGPPQNFARLLPSPVTGGPQTSDATQVAKLMLASQFMGMMSNFFCNHH